MSGQWRKFAMLAVLAAVLVAADQWVKQLVETRMAYHQQIDLLPFFALFRTHNEGIAFSMLSGSGPFALLALNTAIVAFVAWLAWRSPAHQHGAHLGFAMIIAGAIGNMIDRALLGYVVDYFLFHTPAWSFAIFNLADALISVGAALVVAQEFLDWRREKAGPH